MLTQSEAFFYFSTLYPYNGNMGHNLEIGFVLVLVLAFMGAACLVDDVIIHVRFFSMQWLSKNIKSGHHSYISSYGSLARTSFIGKYSSLLVMLVVGCWSFSFFSTIIGWRWRRLPSIDWWEEEPEVALPPLTDWWVHHWPHDARSEEHTSDWSSDVCSSDLACGVT